MRFHCTTNCNCASATRNVHGIAWHYSTTLFVTVYNAYTDFKTLSDHIQDCVVYSNITSKEPLGPRVE